MVIVLVYKWSTTSWVSHKRVPAAAATDGIKKEKPIKKVGYVCSSEIDNSVAASSNKERRILD